MIDITKEAVQQLKEYDGKKLICATKEGLKLEETDDETLGVDQVPLLLDLGRPDRPGLRHPQDVPWGRPCRPRQRCPGSPVRPRRRRPADATRSLGLLGGPLR